MTTRNYRPLQMNRIPNTDLTEAQVLQALRPTASGPVSKSSFSNVLAGKRLRIAKRSGRWLTFDGKAVASKQSV